MRKKLFHFCIVLSCALACALTLSACSDVDIDIDGNGVYSYDDSAGYVKAEATTSETGVYGATISENITEIDVGWVRGKVIVSSSETADSVAFSETGNFDGDIPDEFVMRYRVDGTALKIRFTQSGVNLSSASYKEKKKTLTITVPASVSFTEIDLNTVSADVEASDIRASELSCDTVSGDVTATRCSATEIDFDSVSGDLLLSSCSASSKLNIDTTSGDITVENSPISAMEAESISGKIRLQTTAGSGNIEVKTVSGNVAVVLPSDVAGFGITFDSTSGDFSSDSAVTVSGKTYTYGTPSFVIDCRTVSGDVSVNLGE